MSEETGTHLLELATDIVAAYVGHNTLPAADLPALIACVHAALVRANLPAQAAPAVEALRPAITPKKSVHDEFLICLEDGKKFKSLKRHLRSHFNMSPEDYREKWGLPPDYPMVAPSYAKARSRLAKQMGLGQKRG